MAKNIELTIIVPLFNEEESIRPLYASIKREVGSLVDDYEIIFVDDGSTDRTFACAKALAGRDRKLRIIKFRKNYGQTPAMAAGIDYARGRILVTMDGDLQNDPSDIGKFLEKIDEGFDIVVGWRHNRQDKLLSRKIPSVVANWIIGKVTGVPIKDNGCSLKAFRAEVIKKVPLYSEMHRFIPAMASVAGARVAEIKVRHHARRFGTSKYGLSRIYKVLLDLLAIKTIVSFTARPLAWFAIIAVPSMIASIAILVRVLYSVIADSSVLNIPVAGTGVLFGALAVFLIMSGIIAELIYKTGDIKMESYSSLTMRIYHKERAEFQELSSNSGTR